MKTFLKTLFFLSLFLITAFPQNITQKGVLPDKLITDRLREIHKSNAGGLQGLNDLETLMLKSKSGNLQTALRNHQREFYGTKGLDTKDKRTTINKTILGNGFLLIEETNQRWNGSAWVNSWKYSNTYDENNNQTEFLWQDWNGSAWVDAFKLSYTYDGNNNQTVFLWQTWNGSAWVNNFNESYTYDENNNLSQYLYQTWNGSAWVNSERGPYTYDVNNNLIERFIQSWNGSAWVDSERRSYTYDVNNNRTEWLVQTWDGSAWVNDWRYLNTYDGNNNETEFLYQTWNGSAWVIYWKYSNTYDGNNNLTQYLFQGWDGSAWVNVIDGEKVSFTYDVNNNQTEYLFQFWDGSAWVNRDKYSYIYDENNNLIEYVGQTWDVSNWMDSDKSLLTYALVTAVNEDLSSVNSYNLSNNYPNPFNPSTKITYTLPERGNVSLKVYDLLGGEVAQLVNGEIEAGSYDISFNAANLPSGAYFYQLKAGDFISVKKMLLIK